MGYTKEQFVVEAYSEIGYASYVYDLQPEQLETGLKRLDSMLGTWNGKGIRIGYPIPSSPENSSLSTETNVPDYANEAIITNLAKRLAPTVGKQISTDTSKTARAGYLMLLGKATQPNEMSLPGTMPRGAGQKSWRYADHPFIDDPRDSETIATGYDDELDLN